MYILSAFLTVASAAAAQTPAPPQPGEQSAPQHQPKEEPEAQPAGKYQERIVIDEPVGVAWKPQLVLTSVKFEHPCLPQTLQLRDSDGNIIPHQITESLTRGRYLTSCRLAFVTGLEPYQTKFFSLSYDDTAAQPKNHTRKKQVGLIQRETVLRSVMTSGSTSIRFLSGSAEPDTPLPAANAPAPVEAIRGVDGVWRGRGQLLSPYYVKYWEAEILANGPVFARARVRYQFTGGHHYTLTFTAVKGLNCITVTEEFDMGEKSCFLLRAPNVPFEETGLPDVPEKMALVISRLAPHHQKGATIAGLPANRFETVSGANSRDLFAFFSVEPGDWKNPIGAGINLTKLNTCLTFHYPLEEGTRKWAVQALTIDTGTSENIQSAIRRASDLPLQSVLDMNLTGPAGHITLLKHPKPVPPEMMRADALLELVMRPLQEQDFSEYALRTADLSQVVRAADLYRLLDATGQTTGKLAERVRARLILLGRLLHDPSLYAWNILLHDDRPAGANYDPNTIDWLYNVRRIRALAHIALAVPNWADAENWLQHVEDQYALTLRFLFTPWGMWRGGDAQHPQAVHLLESLAQTLKAADCHNFTHDEAYRVMEKYQPGK